MTDERPPVLSGHYAYTLHIDDAVSMSPCLLCGAAVVHMEGDKQDFRSLHYNWHVSQGHRIP